MYVPKTQKSVSFSNNKHNYCLLHNLVVEMKITVALILYISMFAVTEISEISGYITKLFGSQKS